MTVHIDVRGLGSVPSHVMNFVNLLANRIQAQINGRDLDPFTIVVSTMKEEVRVYSPHDADTSYSYSVTWEGIEDCDRLTLVSYAADKALGRTARPVLPVPDPPRATTRRLVIGRKWNN